LPDDFPALCMILPALLATYMKDTKYLLDVLCSLLSLTKTLQRFAISVMKKCPCIRLTIPLLLRRHVSFSVEFIEILAGWAVADFPKIGTVHPNFGIAHLKFSLKLDLAMSEFSHSVESGCFPSRKEQKSCEIPFLHFPFGIQRSP
jgi:hypothetical protein